MVVSIAAGALLEDEDEWDGSIAADVSMPVGPLPLPLPAERIGLNGTPIRSAGAAEPVMDIAIDIPLPTLLMIVEGRFARAGSSAVADDPSGALLTLVLFLSVAERPPPRSMDTIPLLIEESSPPVPAPLPCPTAAGCRYDKEDDEKGEEEEDEAEREVVMAYISARAICCASSDASNAWLSGLNLKGGMRSGGNLVHKCCPRVREVSTDKSLSALGISYRNTTGRAATRTGLKLYILCGRSGASSSCATESTPTTQLAIGQNISALLKLFRGSCGLLKSWVGVCPNSAI